MKHQLTSWQWLTASLLFCLFGLALPGHAGMMRGKPMDGYDTVFGLQPERVAKDFSVQQIAGSVPANVLWPGDVASFTFQIVNKTPNALKAAGRVEIINYGTRTDPANVFNQQAFNIADIGTVPFEVDIAGGGFTNVTVKPPIPERFGPYALVVELEGHGRLLAAGCVRTPAADPGRSQYPTFAMDARNPGQEELAMFKRLGIKGARMEMGYFPTDSREFYDRFAQLSVSMKAFRDNDVTVLLTLGGGGPQPMGRNRPHLDGQNKTLETKSDMAWLPEHDEDYQQWVKIISSTFGWPRGPVNAVELWNEPWEGLSISGWGADMLRYRDIYTHMAQGVEAARKDYGVKVLIGGTCSSMNTFDKLFGDGSDEYLKWLDFTSIHYQPMGAVPALVPEWATRKSPYGPVRVWDTESWIANSEDRVAGVIASMRAQGQSRTAGVFHDMVSDFQRTRARTNTGQEEVVIVQTWAPAAAIAATQKYIGERAFKELLFKNGLPWIFSFDGLPGKGADDGTLVVVGDLAGIYQHDMMLFRSVHGLSEAVKVQAVEAKLAALPADAPAPTRKALEAEREAAQVLDNATLTIADNGGMFALYDFYGNPLPAQNGKIVVPLNGLGYFLRTDGSKGSFAKLQEAMKTAQIDGYEPLDVIAHDLTARVENGAMLRVSLTNILNRPVTGTLDAALGTLILEPAEQTLTFAPFETKNIEIKVTGKSSVTNTYPLSLTFDAGKDGKKTHKEDLHVNVIARRTIAVDGKLDDWKDALPQPVIGATAPGANLTEQAWLPFVKFDNAVKKGVATGFLAYDDQNIYFAAKVADDTPYDGTVRFENNDDSKYFYPEKVTYVTRDPKTKEVTKEEEQSWPEGVRRFSYRRRPDLPANQKSDSIQLAFNVIPAGQDGWYANPPGTMPRFMAYRDTDYEYALNPVAEQFGGGTEIWRLYVPGMPRKHFFPRQPKTPFDGPVKEGKLAITRDGDMRIVECALPWAEIPEVKKRLDAGELIKFSFRVNDNDPKTSCYELAGGRSVSKINPQAFHNDWETSWANEVEFAFEK